MSEKNAEKGFSSEFPFTLNYEVKPPKKPQGYVNRDTVDRAREVSAGYQGRKEAYRNPNPGTRSAADEYEGKI